MVAAPAGLFAPPTRERPPPQRSGHRGARWPWPAGAQRRSMRWSVASTWWPPTTCRPPDPGRQPPLTDDRGHPPATRPPVGRLADHRGGHRDRHGHLARAPRSGGNL